MIGSRKGVKGSWTPRIEHQRRIVEHLYFKTLEGPKRQSQICRELNMTKEGKKNPLDQRNSSKLFKKLVDVEILERNKKGYVISKTMILNLTENQTVEEYLSEYAKKSAYINNKVYFSIIKESQHKVDKYRELENKINEKLEKTAFEEGIIFEKARIKLIRALINKVNSGLRLDKEEKVLMFRSSQWFFDRNPLDLRARYFKALKKLIEDKDYELGGYKGSLSKIFDNITPRLKNRDLKVFFKDFQQI